MILFGFSNASAQFLKGPEYKDQKEERLEDASRIGRASGPKSPAFQELYDYEAEDKTLVNATFPYQKVLHRAYVVMLLEQKILKQDEAHKILMGLDIVDKKADTASSLQVYMPYEGELIKEIGNVGGKMHIGRSRNDLDNTTNRMFYRDKLLEIIEAILKFREVLLQKANNNLETVMVVYTHRKEAQPITFAHYLTGIDESISKSLDRYIGLYKRIDESPLGSGATGGTSWPLDRLRVAHLLGFKGLVNNTIEGVAGWDHITEFAGSNAIYMSSLSRLASEIQLWSTDEYQMVELDNSFAGISSMMPQKRNPDALERSRKASNLTVGQLMSILSSLNAVEYQHSGVRYPLDPKSLEAIIAATHAMTGLVESLHLNKPRMLKYAKENFSTMTELADVLVRDYALDFRDAHEIIASVVNEAVSKGISADKITTGMITKASKNLLGSDIRLTNEQLQNAIDPWKSILRKTGIGMPSPKSVKTMIVSGENDIIIKNEWLNKQAQYLRTCYLELYQIVEKLKIK